jgi:hypothetical protein
MGFFCLALKVKRLCHGTLLQSASAPTLLSGPPCGLLERKDVDTIGL